MEKTCFTVKYKLCHCFFDIVTWSTLSCYLRLTFEVDIFIVSLVVRVLYPFMNSSFVACWITLCACLVATWVLHPFKNFSFVFGKIRFCSCLIFTLMILQGNRLYVRYFNLKNSKERRCKIQIKFGWNQIIFPYLGYS